MQMAHVVIDSFSHVFFSFDGFFSSGQKREVFKREREVWAGLHFLTLDAFFMFLLQPPFYLL